MDKKDEAIKDLKEYLEGFIKRFKDHSSLHLIDISQHLVEMRRLDKGLKSSHKIGMDGWRMIFKKIICPECKNEMILFETWDSTLKLGKHHKYCCEYCSGIFTVKRPVSIVGKE